MAFPQTSYATAPDAALPGQVVSDLETVSYPCSEYIPFGRFVELHTDGKLRLPQGTTLGKLVGVSRYDSTRPQAAGGGTGGYAIGDMVPVLRKGRIWTVWTGTTRVDMVAPKIRHASTDGDSQAQHRGKVTDAAVDTDAGQENSAAPDGVLMGNQGMSGAIVLELNLPAG